MLRMLSTKSSKFVSAPQRYVELPNFRSYLGHHIKDTKSFRFPSRKFSFFINSPSKVLPEHLMYKPCNTIRNSSFHTQNNAKNRRKTLYEILQISPGCSKKEIKSQFYKLSKKYHPDLSKSSKGDLKAKFLEISEAYKILSNDSLRAEYDRRNRFLINQYNFRQRRSGPNNTGSVSGYNIYNQGWSVYRNPNFHSKSSNSKKTSDNEEQSPKYWYSSSYPGYNPNFNFEENVRTQYYKIYKNSRAENNSNNQNTTENNTNANKSSAPVYKKYDPSNSIYQQFVASEREKVKISEDETDYYSSLLSVVFFVGILTLSLTFFRDMAH
ncbi:hypothetical protein BB560_001749 [Smittium megazygosporum]|uniref:J domain-containing protein n=1 Tax=Smittium megazygosporum TaxID=133381 RepID=A0A2T9ZGW4_9FUNG|nr:hypothetical protein BB560_001749 [Smittium megazygosporum]